MPGLTTIKQIKKLNNLGAFAGYVCLNGQDEFRKFNLVYGFNGTGKTTLSRLLRSLEMGALYEELPSDAQFEIELSNGTTITQAGPWAALEGQIRVFNVDYVEENLRWKKGEASPIYFIGKDQANLATELEELEGQVLQKILDNVTPELIQKEASKAFIEFKRIAARSIDALGIGKRYQANQLEADYGAASYGAEKLLAEEAIQTLGLVINETQPLPKRDTISLDIDGMFKQMQAATDLFQVTLGALALQEFEVHQSMMGWAKAGLEYHVHNDLDDCLLCGNPFSKERKHALQEAIDDKFTKLNADLVAHRAALSRYRDDIQAVTAALPSANDISPNVRANYAVQLGRFRPSIIAGFELLRGFIQLIDQKLAAPAVPFQLGTEFGVDEYVEWSGRAQSAIVDLNAVITEHNAGFDQFAERQQKARTSLREHHLALNQADYDGHVTRTNKASTDLKTAEAELEALKQKVEDLKRATRQHGPAAERLNKLLRSYLGRKELEIAVRDEGFEIRRKGRVIKGSLSEGEKTALAVSYFLCSLEADNKTPEDLVVVIDDPISSLDTRALYYAFSLIKNTLEKAGQLIVMTHNMSFMLEVKKWLYPFFEPKNKSTDPTASFFFLDLRAVSDDDRQTFIVPLGGLIRAYESEYHYLFGLVQRFSESKDFQDQYAYLMPNALRKVLELFLAFKLPSSSGLGDKVKQVANGDYGVDRTLIMGIDRLVQMESHADSLDDFISLSTMTLEQSKDAAIALLGIIKHMDQTHHDTMVRLVKRA